MSEASQIHVPKGNVLTLCRFLDRWYVLRWNGDRVVSTLAPQRPAAVSVAGSGTVVPFPARGR